MRVSNESDEEYDYLGTCACSAPLIKRHFVPASLLDQALEERDDYEKGMNENALLVIQLQREAQRYKEALERLLGAALAAQEGDSFYWEPDYNPTAQEALSLARTALNPEEE